MIMNRGRHIVIEGPPQCGKSTLIQALARCLRHRDMRHLTRKYSDVYFHDVRNLSEEDTGQKLLQTIRASSLDDVGKTLHWVAYYRHLLSNQILTDLEQGILVFSESYFPSVAVNHGYLPGEDIDDIYTLFSELCYDHDPSYYLWLDAEPEVLIQRMQASTWGASLPFLEAAERTVQGYRWFFHDGRSYANANGKLPSVSIEGSLRRALHELMDMRYIEPDYECIDRLIELAGIQPQAVA